MRILLTGGTGFVGSRLLPALLAAGHSVRALVRDPGRLPAGVAAHPSLELFLGSLADPGSLSGCAREASAVVHAAGLVDARREGDFLRINASGSAALAAVAVREALPEARWLHLSSLAASGPGDPVRDGDPARPVSVYGRSKLAGEAAVRELWSGPLLVLRPPGIYGPGDRAFLPWFRAAAAARLAPLPVPAPSPISLLHVDDLVGVVLSLLGRSWPEGRPAYHVSGEEAVAPDGLLRRIAAATGGRARPLRVPIRLVRALAWLAVPFRLAAGRPRYLSPDKVRELRACAWHCTAEGLERDFGWHPRIGLDEGLRATAAAYRASGLLRTPSSGT